MRLINGDSTKILPTMLPNSIDALVCDPPAGIDFMGKDWDGDLGSRNKWINYMTRIYLLTFRVLKPGAHGLVWAIPRTSHWTAIALENAGFEVRDVVTHLFGSGFPKSHDISKAIDKKAGAEAKQYQGFGTALKPSSEHWLLIRKPIEGTIADNVLKYGTGGLNIDGSRIGMSEACKSEIRAKANKKVGKANSFQGKQSLQVKSTKDKFLDLPLDKGRFPANTILSHHPDCIPYAIQDGDEARHDCHDQCPVKLLDEQSGALHAAGNKKVKKQYGTRSTGSNTFDSNDKIPGLNSYFDKGGASRFFYCAKPSKRERNAGLGAQIPHYNLDGASLNKDKDCNPNTKGRKANPIDCITQNRKLQTTGNHHPTVKPIKLMSYLIKLITPPNGIILDPFMGSGTTGVAAQKLGFKFIGIEREKEYFEIAKKRVENTL